MISVVISINGAVVVARSARRTSGKGKNTRYQVDDGRVIKHDPKDGAISLAVKLLEGVTVI